MIGVDQNSATKSKELLLSLSAHRTGKVSFNSCIFVMLIMPVSRQWWALKCLHTKSWNTLLVFSYISSWLLACTWPINLQTALLQHVIYLLVLSYSQNGTARERKITSVHLVSTCLSLAVMLHCKTQRSAFKHCVTWVDARFIWVCSHLSSETHPIIAFITFNFFHIDLVFF